MVEEKRAREPSIEMVLGADEIDQIVHRLGAEITRDHPRGVVLIGVLKGALLFFSDLSRSISEIPVVIDFMAISRFAPDSGRVRMLHDLTLDVTGRDVVLVEDVVDTGLTLAFLTQTLEARGAHRIEVCAFLDRSSRRIVPHEVRYRGIEIGDDFLLGYGLHHHDLYRNLPFLFRVDQSELTQHPDRYVSQVYGARKVPGGIG